MAAQKRARECTTSSPPLNKGKQADDSPQGSENYNQQQLEDAGDSDGSSNPSDGEEEEMVVVNLADVRKEFQCPICLGVIRKTRTVMECLHRFCRECIDKSMRLGNNECPACRTHCASRRSLRDDPNYDALIAALYPDINKYEAEELAFHEEDKNLNTQIQASIAETFQRQAEAQGKKRTSGRAASAVVARIHSSRRNLRRGKSCHVVEYNESDEEEGTNEQSSAEEHRPAIKYKRRKNWSRAQTSQPSSRTNADDGNDSEANEETRGSGELLAWGRVRTRSNNRHGGLTWAGGRLNRSDHVPKLVNYLQSQNDKLMSISLVLVPLKGEPIRSLARPYVTCSLASTVGHLCQYVIMQACVHFHVEMLIMKNVRAGYNTAIFEDDGTCILSPEPSELQVLDDDQTLEEIFAKFIQKDLVLAYRKKVPSIFWLKDTC